MNRSFVRSVVVLLPPLALAGCFDATNVPGHTTSAIFCEGEENPCPATSAPVDLDADGCADRCEPTRCESVATVACPGNAMPTDLDGDGCARECPSVPSTDCGGLAHIACARDAFCEFPMATACGSGDQTGTCVPLASLAQLGCPAIYEPVCGCDGKTYGNACEAHVMAASVARDGACEVACPALACANGTRGIDTDGDGCLDECSGHSCGGLVPQGVDNTCAANEYCDYSLSAICGAADATGVCMPRPQICDDLYQPVCGCNGTTFPNECNANASGTGILHYGKCDVVCPAIYPVCGAGQVPVDANHDGCIDGCGAPS